MKQFPFAGCLVLAFIHVACSESPTGPGGAGSVASISIAPDVAFGALGSTVQLSATPLDAGGNPVQGRTVSWSTSGGGVVTIDPSSGLLTSIGNGSETIRASVGSVQGTLDVTVQQVPLSLDISPPTTSFNRVGTSLTLQPAAADSNGNPVSDPGSFTFASSAPGVVHVDGAGLVTANWPGSAEITVEGGGFSDAATFTVTITGSAGGPVLGGEQACAGGAAAGFDCDGVDLVSYMPLAGLGAGAGVKLNDMWGWTDAMTSRQYVLVGRTDGLTFVDVTDALNTRALGHLPAAAAPASWRDVKVYADHAYVVADGSPGHGVQIFDLTRLRDVEVFTTFAEDARYTGVSSVHNIAINEESGFGYAVGSGGGGNTCGGGLHMIDLSSPLAPTFAGCFMDATTGRSLTGYTHDVQCVIYDGPDSDYAGREICIGSNETAVSIADVTDKGNPVAVSTGRYPDSRYIHQGWLTEDHAYFVQNDELDELGGVVTNTRMLVWDVSDLDDPTLVAEHFGPTGAIDHNMYVRGDLLFHSNYHFGLRVIDITDPAAPVERGFFDTHPPDDALGFDGSWSNYPWLADGVVAVTSAQEGLFLLRVP
jgi:choice-of-anchor B domain-containing protein